jgi:hypothetical protein
MTQVRVGSQLRCPYCHDALVGHGRKTGCEACFAWHHASCMTELGRCGNCGTAARREPSVASERARLNALLATGCTHHSCRSLDTIAVGRSYVCKRHVREQLNTMWAVGVSMAVALVMVLGLAAMQGQFSSEKAFLMILIGALFAVSGAFMAWHGRTLRKALASADKRAEEKAEERKQERLRAAEQSEGRAGPTKVSA